MKKQRVFMSHTKDGDRHAVAAHLRVLIVPGADGGFVAQGLDVDYVATGLSVEDAQERFAEGFLRTVRAIIRRNSRLDSLFKSKPPREAWGAYMESDRQDALVCGTVVDLTEDVAARIPYQRLEFCLPGDRAPLPTACA